MKIRPSVLSNPGPLQIQDIKPPEEKTHRLKFGHVHFPSVYSAIPHNILRRRDDTLRLSYELASWLKVVQGSLRGRAGTKGEPKGEGNWREPLCAESGVKSGEDISL